MIKIYVDDTIFYTPSISKLAITEAQMHEDADSIDSFKLSAPHNHPYIHSIKPMRSIIKCKKGNDVVFEGRALDDGTDFYNSHSWTCESCMAYLKDSVQPPFTYKGTLKGLLEYFLNIHNESVDEYKTFVLGSVTVKDENDYISYSNSDYSLTLDAIRSKLINTHGGYLQVRYDKGNRILDYLEDFNLSSIQKVEFGKNLLDVSILKDHTERISALIPLGAKDEETGERVTIESVNGGKNYIVDEKAVQEIGWIWATEIWGDVTLPGNLLRKGSARLAELSQGLISMELSIIDESDTGADIGDIRARMYVECISKPHGINGRYLVKSRTIDYLNPSQNKIKIGASGVTLTEAAARQNKNLTSLENDIFGQSTKIDSIEGKVKDINDSKMYRTELVVDGVNIFKEKNQQSKMICKVYSWDKDITDTLDASCFNWIRKSNNEVADQSWNLAHVGMKQITISTEDVTENASFFCVVTI